MTQESRKPIVVGVDGSADARRALEWAMEESTRSGLPLLLIHGVDVGVAAASPYGSGTVLEQLEEAGEQVLAEELAVVRRAGIDADGRIEIGSAAYALIEASRGASMLVVGNRGHGGFTGMLLGSVSTACSHHAHCPVVVVRPPDK